MRFPERNLLEHARARRERERARRTAVRVVVGRVPVGLTARHAANIRDELAQARQDAPLFDGKWISSTRRNQCFLSLRPSNECMPHTRNTTRIATPGAC